MGLIENMTYKLKSKKIVNEEEQLEAVLRNLETEVMFLLEINKPLTAHDRSSVLNKFIKIVDLYSKYTKKYCSLKRTEAKVIDSASEKRLHSIYNSMLSNVNLKKQYVDFIQSLAMNIMNDLQIDLCSFLIRNVDYNKISNDALIEICMFVLSKNPFAVDGGLKSSFAQTIFSTQK